MDINNKMKKDPVKEIPKEEEYIKVMEEDEAGKGLSEKGTDKRKQSLYFPESMLKEIQYEAQRQDRSLSWIVQKAWKIAREKIKELPSSE